MWQGHYMIELAGRGAHAIERSPKFLLSWNVSMLWKRIAVKRFTMSAVHLHKGGGAAIIILSRPRPLSRSGHSGYPPGTVPGMRERKIIPQAYLCFNRG